MGKVFSIISRPLKNFNVENRARSVITTDKPTAAPRHPSTIKYIEDKYDEAFMQLQRSKPEELLERLKIVKVNEKKGPIETPMVTNKPLPQITKSVELPDMGFVEPDVAHKGRVTLTNTIVFLTKHQNNPEEYNSSHIASDYKLDLKITQDILDHYKLLNLKDLTQKIVNPKPRLNLIERIRAIPKSMIEQKKE